MHPQILLLDEITAALDPEMVREVLQVVLELAKDGMTMLIVTHEMEFARAVADRVIFLDSGKIVEEGSPEEFFTIQKLIGLSNFLIHLVMKVYKELKLINLKGDFYHEKILRSTFINHASYGAFSWMWF